MRTVTRDQVEARKAAMELTPQQRLRLLALARGRWIVAEVHQAQWRAFWIRGLVEQLDDGQGVLTGHGIAVVEYLHDRLDVAA